MISESWFGEYLYSSTAYKSATATAIEVFGNDHYVTNTIVFSSKIGVHVTNPANVLTGVHSWNLNAGDGGIGFLIESTQNRLFACYFDGNDVVVKAPIETVSIEGGFFLEGSQIVLEAAGNGSVIDGLSITGNQFLYGGSEPILRLDESNGQFSSVTQMTVRDNLIQSGHLFVQPRISDSLTQSESTQFEFDFKGQLLFDTERIAIAWVDYTVQYNDGSFTAHALRRPNGTTVLVEFEQKASATVYVTVDQSTSECY